VGMQGKKWAHLATAHQGNRRHNLEAAHEAHLTIRVSRGHYLFEVAQCGHWVVDSSYSLTIISLW
jgi:hypothetical protein